LLSYFLIGIAVGALTSIPIGPVNVAIIDAAYRHHLGRAVAVGLGGAVADMGYAIIGVLGLSPILLAHPSVPPTLYAVSGVVLIVYGILTVRAQPVDPGGASAGPADEKRRSWFWSGFLLGLALILLNPATLVAWVVIAGSALAGTTMEEGIATAIGIGVGSGLWFTAVAHLAHHGKKVLGRKVVLITRIVGACLIGYGLFCLGRAGHYVLTQM
jgi:threonine/homoserine/homoserine lactone efflux protein